MFSFIEGGQLSLREYKQFLESNFHKWSFDINYENRFAAKGIYTKPLFYFIQLLGIDELKKRIYSLKTKRVNLDVNYTWHCLHLLISLSELPYGEEKKSPISIEFRSETYQIDFEGNNYLIRPQVTNSTEIKAKVEDFKQDEFYDLLLLNLDKIQQLKLNKY